LNYNNISRYIFAILLWGEVELIMIDRHSEKILQAIKELNDQMNDRIREVNKRFDAVDKRFKQIDRRFEEVDKRFEQIDKRFDEIDKRFDNVEARQEKMQNGFDILVKREMDNEADIVGIKKAIGQQ